MKSQSEQTSLSSEQDNFTLENLLSQEENQYATPQCSGGNQGLDYCFNEKCKQKPVFICGIRDCECRRKHKMCQKGCIESTINHIHSKIYDSKRLDDHITDKFDQIIDKISDLRERVIQKVQNQFKLLLLDRNQRQFLRKIKQHEFSNITSQELNNVWKAIQTTQEKNIDLFDEGNKLLEGFEQNLNKQITKFEQSLNDKIYDLHHEDIQTIEKIKKKSSILINDELIDRLLRFFPKRVKSIKIMYKASKENFSVEKYFQLCGKEKNTVIIAETTMGKILGAFTPLSMLGSPTFLGQYIADPEGKSFLFSLSQNDKFTLRNRERAINLSPTHDAIRFGNAEFKISNKTPMQRYNGLSYLTNRYYENDKYQPNRQGYQKLNGNENEEFMTKEWEVWKVDFDDQPKKDDDKPESDLDQEDKSIVFEDGSILY